MDFKFFLNTWNIAKVAKVAYVLFVVFCTVLGDLPPAIG
jgi:hypothetical protein